MTRPDPAWQRAAALAGTQRMLITRRQCIEAGLAPTQITRAVSEGGRWQRVLPGVYAIVTGLLSADQRAAAALLFTGPAGQLAGRTALERYGVRYLPADDGLVHVLVPHVLHVSSRGYVRVHRCAALPPVRWRAGLPCSPPDHAAVLACRDGVPLRDARALLAEVVQRRLTTVEHLARVLEQGHSAGSAVPRRVLADLRAGCRSAPEMELRDLVLRDPVLAAPARWNHPIMLSDGSLVVGDGCWPEVLLVAEVDSVEHHEIGWTSELTAQRRAALVADGWTVLSISPYRIRSEPRDVLGQLRRTYDRLLMIQAA